MPTVDEMQAYMIELVDWRQKNHDALLSGEVYTDEEKLERQLNCLHNDLYQELNVFPIWDDGKDKTRKRWEIAITRLDLAVGAYLKACINPTDWMHTHTIAKAKETLDLPFIPYPYAQPTAKEKAAERASFEEGKKQMIENLMMNDKGENNGL